MKAPSGRATQAQTGFRFPVLSSHCCYRPHQTTIGGDYHTARQQRRPSQCPELRNLRPKATPVLQWNYGCEKEQLWGRLPDALVNLLDLPAGENSKQEQVCDQQPPDGTATISIPSEHRLSPQRTAH